MISGAELAADDERRLSGGTHERLEAAVELLLAIDPQVSTERSLSAVASALIPMEGPVADPGVVASSPRPAESNTEMIQADLTDDRDR